MRKSAMTPAAAWTFLAVWIPCHLLYPAWFPLSGGQGRAAAAFLILAAAAVGAAAYLRPLLRKGWSADEELRELALPPGDRVFWALLAAAFLIRVYALSLPHHLATAGDEGVHMGFPALPFKLWARQAPVPMPVLFWAGMGALFWLRRPLKRLAGSLLQALLRPSVPALLAAAVLLTVYCLGVYAVVDRLTDTAYPSFTRDLLRFPPLSKFLRFGSYGALGLSSFSGRIPEFLLFACAAWTVYKTGLLARSRSFARLASAVFLFFPPFAYYSTKGSQSCGELLFFSLTAWFFVRWALRGRPSALYWAVIAVGAGTMYRYSLPLAGIVFAAAALLVLWRDPARRGDLDRRTVLELGGMAALMVVPWMLVTYQHGTHPYAPRLEYYSVARIAAALGSIPAALSWPAAAVAAAGFTVSLFRRRDALQKLLLAWFAINLIFIVGDWHYATLGADAEDKVRMALPMFLPLAFWAAELPAAAEKIGRELGECLAAFFVAYLVAISTFAAPAGMHPVYALRHSLRTEYVPLKRTADFIESLPEGTRLLGVDLGPGDLSLDLLHPRRVEWSYVRSAELGSLDALAALCREKRAAVVMFLRGTNEAGWGTPKADPGLFSAFEGDAGRFAPMADLRRGENRVLFRKFVP